METTWDTTEGFSNRGPQFALKFMKDLLKVLGTKRMLSMMYYPQIDRQTKRINQEVGIFLWHYVNYQQDDWAEWLVAAEFQYNDKKYAAIGRTPFKLNFGKQSWKGDLIVKMELPKLEEFLEGLKRSWSQAKISMDMAKEAIKKQFNKKRRNP